MADCLLSLARDPAAWAALLTLMAMSVVLGIDSHHVDHHPDDDMVAASAVSLPMGRQLPGGQVRVAWVQ